jgi:hypothetical protein
LLKQKLESLIVHVAHHAHHVAKSQLLPLKSAQQKLLLQQLLLK